MKRCVDRVLPIFPFEEALYQREGMDVRFVGHPLIDLARPALDRDAFLRDLKLDPASGAGAAAWQPAQRARAARRVMAERSAAIAEQVPGVQFVVARAPQTWTTACSSRLAFRRVTLRIVEGSRRRAERRAMRCHRVGHGDRANGAARQADGRGLQALADDLSARQAMALVDTYAMVNLIAGERVVVELIQDACTPEAVPRKRRSC